VRSRALPRRFKNRATWGIRRKKSSPMRRFCCPGREKKPLHLFPLLTSGWLLARKALLQSSIRPLTISAAGRTRSAARNLRPSGPFACPRRTRPRGTRVNAQFLDGGPPFSAARIQGHLVFRILTGTPRAPGPMVPCPWPSDPSCNVVMGFAAAAAWCDLTPHAPGQCGGTCLPQAMQPPATTGTSTRPPPGEPMTWWSARPRPAASQPPTTPSAP
jgi:hypothetical protein